MRDSSCAGIVCLKASMNMAGPDAPPVPRRDERGALFAEYAIVMITVTLVAAIAIGALAVPLLNLYTFAETLIGLPVP